MMILNFLLYILLLYLEVYIGYESKNVPEINK